MGQYFRTRSLRDRQPQQVKGGAMTAYNAVAGNVGGCITSLHAMLLSPPYVLFLFSTGLYCDSKHVDFCANEP
jgi:hypothetical protein